MLPLFLAVVSVLSTEPVVLTGLGPGVEARCTPVPGGSDQDGVLATLTAEGPPAAEFVEDRAGKILRAQTFVVDGKNVVVLFDSSEADTYLRHVCVVVSSDLNSGDTRRALAWSVQRVLDVIFLQGPLFPLPGD